MTPRALENYNRLTRSLETSILGPRWDAIERVRKMHAISARPTSDLRRARQLHEMAVAPLRVQDELRRSATASPALQMFRTKADLAHLVRTPMLDAARAFERSALGPFEIVRRHEQMIRKALLMLPRFELADLDDAAEPKDADSDLGVTLQRWAAMLRDYRLTREDAETVLRFLTLSLATTYVTLSYAAVKVSPKAEAAVAWLLALAYVVVLTLPSADDD